MKDKDGKVEYSKKLDFFRIVGVSLHDSKDELSFPFVEVRIQRQTPIVFGIKEAHVDDLIQVFNENPVLLKEDISVNLFEVQTIMDKIKKEWIYKPIGKVSASIMMGMSGKEITNLFIDYFKNGIVPEWLAADYDIKNFCMDSDKAMSDLEILYQLSWLYFETKDSFSARLSMDRISFVGYSIRADDVYLQNRGIDYQAIIDTVREKFGVPMGEERGLDAVIYECVMKYLRNSSGGKLSDEECIELANSSDNPGQFKQKYKKRIRELGVSLVQSSVSSSPHVELYVARSNAGFNNGGFTISRRGIQMAYKNESKGFNGFSGEEKIYEGNELWEVCFNMIKEHFQKVAI